MINKTGNKDIYTRPDARLKFTDFNAALDMNGVVKKNPAKSFGQKHFENLNAKKSLSNSFLGTLNADDLSRLRPHLEPVTLSPGKILYQPQDCIRCIYFPESAIVSDLQMLEDGRTVEIAMTGKEGVIGLASFFSSRLAVNWTEVIVAGSALRLNAQILRRELVCNNRLQISLFNCVNSYIERLSQKIICHNYHQLRERLCSWLLMLQDRNGSDTFFLTHEQIARFLGVHRPGISHITNELRERKIIDYRRGQIFILNARELENLTCSCFYSS